MIDTASALSKMNDTYDYDLNEAKTYGLRFISKGGFREIYNARKAVKQPKQQGKEPHKSSNKKLNGLVQVFDEDIKEYRDIKYAQIVAFRDYKSKQWIPVRLN